MAGGALAAPAPAALWPLVKGAASSWLDDRAPSMGAALAYYMLFSIAPLLLIVISVAGLVFGQDAARGEIFAQLRLLMGDDGAAAVEGLLESLRRPGHGALGILLGAVALVVGATTVFAELQDAMDRIWRSPPPERSRGWLRLLRSRALSFAMVLAIGFLLIVSLVASAAIAAWGRWFTDRELIGHLLNEAVAFALATLAFALIYKILPRVRIRWHDVWIGAAVTAALFTLGKLLIGLYIGKSGIASGFGAASSVVVVLVWVYYSAQIFLLGAEFTRVYAEVYGSRRGRRHRETHGR